MTEDRPEASPWTAPVARLDRDVRLARRLTIVALLMAFAFISHVNRISISTAGNARIMEGYGISPTQMGSVYSALLLTYTLCMVPGGMFIDRFGPRAALTAVGFGSAVFVALTGAAGYATHSANSLLLSLLVVRGLLGVVFAPLHPALARAVSQWMPPGARAQTNGVVNGSALLGIAVTPLGFGFLIGRLDWPAAFLVTAGVTGALATAWALLASDGTQGDPRAAGPGDAGAVATADSGWKGLLANRSLWYLTAAYAAVGYFQYLFFYWMDFYFEKVLKLPVETSRFYAAIPALAMAVGMPLGGWLSDRLDRATGTHKYRAVVPAAGMIAGAALLVAGVFAKEPAWIVTWFALALGAVGMSEGPCWATAIELGGRRGGSSAAVFNTGGNLGGLLAPVVTPWVGDQYGWGPAVTVGAVVCLVGVACLLGVDPAERPRPASTVIF